MKLTCIERFRVYVVVYINLGVFERCHDVWRTRLSFVQYTKFELIVSVFVEGLV